MKAIVLPLIAGLLFQGTAIAQDKLFDASNPAEMAAALRAAGYKAELKKDTDGDPYIASAANGSNFEIDFYECKEGKCTSFQFSTYYDADPLWTPALANDWNAHNRFLKVAVNDKGQLTENLYGSGVGKLTQANFADLVDWFQLMDNGLSKFIADKRAAAKSKGK